MPSAGPRVQVCPRPGRSLRSRPKGSACGRPWARALTLAGRPPLALRLPGRRSPTSDADVTGVHGVTGWPLERGDWGLRRPQTPAGRACRSPTGRASPPDAGRPARPRRPQLLAGRCIAPYHRFTRAAQAGPCRRWSRRRLAAVVDLTGRGGSDGHRLGWAPGSSGSFNLQGR
ncbi:hypothetical protein HD597_000191 [Nonomuraea thailandensis]|uniref:Uncharacterized protein n=1 Tax=Nonomuraea thailandensis TaxID=1188745 RepID=A0A9X2K158_9ACTN|nr:hypothetical protein [Nonomuraea thailandensis]